MTNMGTNLCPSNFLSLPNNDVGVFHPEPGSQHAPIRPADGDDRAVLGSGSAELHILDQDGKIRQGLLCRQVVEVFAVLQGKPMYMLTCYYLHRGLAT